MRIKRVAVAFFLVAACAHQPQGAAQDRSVLTRTEIASATGAANMYDVIARLRHEYLVSRGRTSLTLKTEQYAMVFLNEQEYGTIESLRTIHPDMVEEVRYFNSTTAPTRFGYKYGTGVIQVRTR